MKVEYNSEITHEKFDQIYKTFDGIVIAIGAQGPRVPDFKGNKKAISALKYLTSCNSGKPAVDVKDKNVVVIGAGDVGMDVCTMAWQKGAASTTAVDIREPASSSRERTGAMALGTRVLWPRVVKAFEAGKVLFEGGETLPADVLIVSIGEVPESEWIPEFIGRTKGLWISVNEYGQTNDPKVYAVGDVVKPGLLANSIGQGRVAALALHARLTGGTFELPHKQVIPLDRLKLLYFSPRSGHIPPIPWKNQTVASPAAPAGSAISAYPSAGKMPSAALRTAMGPSNSAWMRTAASVVASAPRLVPVASGR